MTAVTIVVRKQALRMMIDGQKAIGLGGKEDPREDGCVGCVPLTSYKTCIDARAVLLVYSGYVLDLWVV